MGNQLRVGKPSPNVTSQPGQLSSVGKHNEYGTKLGNKQAHDVMHQPRISGLAGICQQSKCR